jgi:fatty-acyl-CoA synthase
MGLRTRIRSNLVELSATWRMISHVREFGPSGEYNPARYLYERATRDPNNLAILFEDRRYTWRDVNAEVNRYARFFKAQGVGQGDVVTLMMDNRPEFLFVAGALSRLRAIGALINTNITGAGLTHAVNIAEPKLAQGPERRVDTPSPGLWLYDLAGPTRLEELITVERFAGLGGA